jgi:phosphate transport system ATP-binding protein
LNSAASKEFSDDVRKDERREENHTMSLKTRAKMLNDGQDNAGQTENWLSATTNAPIKIEVDDLNSFYGEKYVLHHVSISIPESAITVIVGPSGSGKTTFLRSLNRLHDLTPGARMTGNIVIDGADILLFSQDGEKMSLLRQRVGMLFQHAHPFPLSIFENVAYGIHLPRRSSRNERRARVEQALRQVGLWDEMKDHLKQNALQLAFGQQRLLCMARILATSPEVLLLDEPYAGLDPRSVHILEDQLLQLSPHYTIVITMANPYLAQRIANATCTLLDGYLTRCLWEERKC